LWSWIPWVAALFILALRPLQHVSPQWGTLTILPIIIVLAARHAHTVPFQNG